MRSHIKLIEKIRKNTKKNDQKLLACDDICAFLLQVLLEAPAVFGPKQGSNLVCIQCCRTLSTIQVPRCIWVFTWLKSQTWSVSSAAGIYQLFRYPHCVWVLTGLKPGLYPVLQESTNYTGTHVVFGSSQGSNLVCIQCCRALLVIQVLTLHLGLPRAQTWSVLYMQCCKTLPATYTGTNVVFGSSQGSTWPVSSAAGLYLQATVQVPTLYLGLNRA
jgi:hypothetical protein